MQNIIFTKYSNDRDPKFNIVTEIVSNDLGEKWVVKRPFTEEAETHVSRIVENCSILKEQYRGTNVEIADAVKDGETVRIAWVEGEAFSEYLDRLLRHGRREEWTKQVKAYFDCVLAHKKKQFVKTAEFEAMFGNVSIGEEEEAISNVDVDMLFSNVLYKDGKWTLYDYEWTVGFDVPVKFLIYRCLHYYTGTWAKRAISLNNVYDEFGITKEQTLIYEEMENHFQRYIEGKHVPMWRLYHNLHGKVVDARLLQERYVIEHQAQVYYDFGEGYSEINSKQIVMDENGERQYKVLLPIPKNTCGVRFDPMAGACIMKIIRITDGEGKVLSYVTNGYQIDRDNYIFLHVDPQIVISKELQDKVLQIEYLIWELDGSNGTVLTQVNQVIMDLNKKRDKLVQELQEQERYFMQQKDEQEKLMQEQENRFLQQMQEQESHLKQTLHTLRSMESSLSWKITKPLRYIRKKVFILKKILKSVYQKIRNTVSPSETIVYNIESPINNSVDLYGHIIIKGWAFSTISRPVKLNINIGNRKINVPVKQLRKDVGGVYEEYGERSKMSGFWYEYKIPEKMYGNQIEIAFCFRGKRCKRTDYRKVLVSAPEEIQAIKNKLHETMSDYDIWVQKNLIQGIQLERMRANVNKCKSQPLLSILLPTYNADERLLREALDSIYNQIYQKWEICIVDDGSNNGIDVERVLQQYVKLGCKIKYKKLGQNRNISAATNEAFAMSKGNYIFLMDHDDLLERNALSEVVEALNIYPDIDVIYSDDDKIDMEGKRYAPQFKPDFSPELLLSFMYFSHIFVIKRELFARVGGLREGYEGSQDYDLALRVTELAQNVYHIPKILYHWRATPQSTASSTNAKPESITRGQRAVQDAIRRRGINAKVARPEFAEKLGVGIFSLQYSEECFPKVSIIIPTKNHLDILKRCLESIREKTTYRNYEILLVDNDSNEETIEYYKNLEYKVISVSNENGMFNFSKMVNEGVRFSSGEYIILLNNDTEVIEPAWIENMLVYQKITGVGVVGAKLLYSDNTIQHAGVVLGMQNGIASHAFKLLPEWDGGLLSYAKVARNYSAVTAAALMTSKEIYNEVGGFDEINFAISYNDVDFCMKVGAKGYRVVYSPESLLYHHEGKSRGTEQTGHYSDGKEEYNFVSKWLKDRLSVDKYYNPNLSLKSERFEMELRKKYVDKLVNLKVLLITHNLNFEGAPLVQYNVAQDLSKRGFKFSVLSLEDGPLSKRYKEIGIDIHIIGVANFSCIQECDMYCENVYNIVRNGNYDIIYANTIINYWAVKVAEKLKVGVIWSIHESTTIEAFFTYADAELIKEIRECFMKATKVLFVADATAKLYNAFDVYNFYVIRNGIDLIQVSQSYQLYNRVVIRNSLGVDEDTVIISIFGTFCLRKGQRDFVEIADKLLKKYNGRICFLMVGQNDTSYGNEIIELVKEKGISNEIIILGTSTEIYKYYIATDIYVCTSYEESSPLVLLEAMAFKKGIVSTNVHGIPELVRNNQEAILCNPGNIAELADGVEKLMLDKELYDRLSKNAYFRVKTFFNKRDMINEYIYLMNEVYDGKDNLLYENLCLTNNTV